LLSEIEEYVGIQETNREIIRKAIKSNFKDFEDAIQYFSAVMIRNIDIITTRDLTQLDFFYPNSSIARN